MMTDYNMSYILSLLSFKKNNWTSILIELSMADYSIYIFYDLISNLILYENAYICMVIYYNDMV
jgi:hypothetical protein